MNDQIATEEIFLDGDKYFDSLFNDIAHATTTITIEMYIFNDDVLGQKMTSALLDAKKRGVYIQMIIDGIGSYHFHNKLFDLFKSHGIHVKMYNPLPFYHPYYGEVGPLKKVEILIMRLWRINKRNHRKIIIIDNKIMYVGSFNFMSESTRYFMEKAWKDIGAKVTGNIIEFATLNFKKIWRKNEYYRYKKKLRILNIEIPHWKTSVLRLQQNILMKVYFIKDYINRINNSKDKIWLMTPYFIPKRKIIRALGNAASRGVDVKVLISKSSDIKFFKFLQYFYYPYLLKKGVKVYHYSESVLHAKLNIIDQWTMISSSNLNHRSLLHDLEFDLVIQNKENIDLIEKNFIECTPETCLVTQDDLKNRPLTHKILCRTFFLFKYWF